MKGIVSKLLFLTNYLLIIFYMSWNINQKQTAIGSGVPLLISCLMLIDVTYISSCNIRESKVMNLFCGLLALDSWYLLLSVEEGGIEQIILTGGCEPQLEVHINGSLNVGLSPEKIIETFIQCIPYTGFPKVLNAIYTAKRIFAERHIY